MSTASDDIVAVGGRLDPDVLMEAYRRGIFPWPVEGLPMLWFCPKRRAVLDFEELHVSRSLARARRKSPFRFTIDTAFQRVIEACASIERSDQPGTWITPEVIRAYVRLHERGAAHSVEAWYETTLVGGIYGVDSGGAFSAESMFHREPYASKLAFLFLVDHLRARGLGWIDIQVISPHMAQMGAKEIPRREFLKRLKRALEREARAFP